MHKETISSAELILGDCMEYMATFPDNAFELAIVDPPYGIGAGSDKFVNGTSKCEKSYYRKDDWDKDIPSIDYFNMLCRVSGNQIIWGGNYFGNLWPCRGFIFWDKTIHGNSYSDGELAWTSFDTPARYFRENIAQSTSEGRIHATQKSITIYKWLLSHYAKPGDRILDTHGGSGSSVIACLDLGFPIVWIEKDADYYEAALKRIKDFASQPKLFDEPAQTFTQGDLDLDSRPT
jgi:site-specific DNA-methyltransferase (adenine-specific)